MNEPRTPTNDPRVQADLMVIGFGKGGKTLAAALGRQGWRVVMIEQSADMYSGTCINVGGVSTNRLSTNPTARRGGSWPGLLPARGGRRTGLDRDDAGRETSPCSTASTRSL